MTQYKQHKIREPVHIPTKKKEKNQTCPGWLSDGRVLPASNTTSANLCPLLPGSGISDLASCDSDQPHNALGSSRTAGNESLDFNKHPNEVRTQPFYKENVIFT